MMFKFKATRTIPRDAGYFLPGFVPYLNDLMKKKMSERNLKYSEIKTKALNIFNKF